MADGDIPIARSRLAPLLQPLGAFLAAESAGGALLLIATALALVWANSHWAGGYVALWNAKATIGISRFVCAMSLRHWVDDGLMTLFFLLVGLEIKRELLIGELASPRKAALPVMAAMGGMLVPALIYACLNARGTGAAGWGVPMATDIAFAAGVLAIVGRGLPGPAKVFLLAVAIVDDLGAVLVIAFFYTQHLSLFWLAFAGGCAGALVVLNLLRVHNVLPYMVMGVGLWIATLNSGISPTIAGVLLAFTIPATRQVEEVPYVHYIRRMLSAFERDATAFPDKITEDQSHALKAMETASQAVQTPLARVEHALLRPVNFIVVPLFALANAGVGFRSAGAAWLTSPVFWGIVLGLILGKPIGILSASWSAVRLGIAKLPSGVGWRALIGVSILCGIGFTMSLFIATLAFANHAELIGATKTAILVASCVAGIAGAAMIRAGGGRIE